MGGRTKYNLLYRFIYGLVAFAGCMCPLQTVWDLSDRNTPVMLIYPCLM